MDTWGAIFYHLWIPQSGEQNYVKEAAPGRKLEVDIGYSSFFSGFTICLLLDNSLTSLMASDAEINGKILFLLKIFQMMLPNQSCPYKVTIFDSTATVGYFSWKGVELSINWPWILRPSCDGLSGMGSCLVQIPLDSWTPKLHPFKTHMTLITDFAGFVSSV